MQDVFIAILSAWLTSFLTAKYLKGNDNKNREADIANSRRVLAKALRSELLTLREIYRNMEVSPAPPKSGNDISVSYLSQNYISIYEHNIERIGLLKEEDIPCIVELYICIKSLIDSLICLSNRWELFAMYTRGNDVDEKEMELKYRDVENAHRGAYECQKRIFELYPVVIEKLSKYDNSKED